MSFERILFKLTSSNSSNYISIDVPNKCPHCFDSIRPHIVSKTDYDDKLKLNVAVLYQCPSCQKYFANEYHLNNSFNNSISAFESVLIPYVYKSLVKYDLPDELENISHTFVEIYTQSLTAESDGLSQICGIGFRKAIEFLVKDFLINFQKEDSDKIAKLQLSQAISKLESHKIKSLALASVWLGNDETHYQRKYADKDVNDMKKFIRALAYFISSELTASEAQDFINP